MRPLHCLLFVAALLVACDSAAGDGAAHGDADADADASVGEDVDTSVVGEDVDTSVGDTASGADADTAAGADAGADTAADAGADADADADAGADVVAVTGVRLVWDLDAALAATPDDRRFFDYPWPESQRLDADGTLNLTGFPNPAAATGCTVGASSPVVTVLLQAVALPDYRAYVVAATDRDSRGYGTNTPIYFHFDGPLATALPSPADTLTAGATVQLVDVDPASPRRGERTPLVTRISDGSLYLPPHTLALAPAPGFPLAPGTRYAAIVLRSHNDAGGAPLETPSALDALLGSDPGASPQAALYAAALGELAASGVPAADLAAITVFTTGDPLAPLTATAAAIEAIADPTPLAAVEITAVTRDADRGYWRVSGTVNTLDWQRGTPPYLPPIHPNFPIDLDHLGDLLLPGGFDVAFDPEDTAGALLDGPAPVAPDGADPDVPRTERVPFELALPLAALDPGGDASALPLVLYGHGTGGSERSPLGADREASDLAALGIATFAIPGVMHEGRAHVDNLDPALIADLETLGELLDTDAVSPLTDVVVGGAFFFNPLSAAAGRGNVLQSAVDFLWLAHALSEAVIAVPLPDGGGAVAVAFDPEHIAFFGHSQGGLTGPLTALSPHLSATFLSAPGGHLASTLLTKELPADPFAVKDLFAWVVCDPSALDPLHPFIAVLSTFFEAADPLNYAALMVAEPVAGGRHVFITEGTTDHYATPPTNEAITTGARLTQVAPVLSPVLGQALLGAVYGGFEPAASAVSGNVVHADGAWTAGFKQYHGESGCSDDHFVYRCVAQARQDWAHFFATWLTPGPSEIGSGP
ncbi:MAG: hypothetical protein CVU56_07060 [Deltaproteobacteria bacterium HGW-Deltaproteobacteria-14]|nr:MAG: hypothetical protein CVU56_07060 [Deltaproteobacteria bacterium HGW-Deltaproteobacteria-14]